MKSYDTARAVLANLLRGHPRVKRLAAEAEALAGSYRHAAAAVVPQVIRPRPFEMMVAVTAHCNARCIGCRYGRDFMPGHQLGWEMTRDLLDDARAGGVSWVRFYGGEPLLHHDLPKMVAHTRKVGMLPYVTTNAILLGKKFDELYAAGLRDMTVGFYGVGEAYDAYVQRPGLFRKVESSIAAVREKYGDKVKLQLNWLLMRPSCTMEALHAAWDFAERYDMTMQIDLIHYSLPYFTEGPESELQFRPEDRPAVEAIARELLRLKAESPGRFRQSLQLIRSIPDWLMLGPDMKVPCTAYDLLWVGADGTVQLCYVTFKLGNLHESRLRDMLYTTTHACAARDAFALHCPGCHCDANKRILRHGPSRARYRDDGVATIGDPISTDQIPTIHAEGARA